MLLAKTYTLAEEWQHYQMDAMTPRFEARLAAGEGELGPEGLPKPQHCAQHSPRRNPASFTFTSLVLVFLETSTRKEDFGVEEVIFS